MSDSELMSGFSQWVLTNLCLHVSSKGKATTFLLRERRCHILLTVSNLTNAVEARTGKARTQCDSTIYKLPQYL